MSGLEEMAVLAVIRASRPCFRSKPDKVAFAVHAFVLSRGYKLVAVGPAAEAEAADWALDHEEVGPEGWNDTEGVYAFRYQDLQGARPALYVKAVAAGPQLLAHWLEAAPQPALASPRTLELDTERYATDSEAPSASYSHLGELLVRLAAAMGGGMATGAQAGRKAAEPAEPAARAEPRLEPEGRPGWAQPGPGPGFPAPPVPSNVGADDVVPPGFRPPGMGPTGGGDMPGLHPGGGMVVGPGHPIFGPGRLGGPVGGPPGLGSLPLGARWDPIAPPGMRGFHPNDFQRRPDPAHPHPDIMQPGPRNGNTDWDAMFG